MGVGVLLGARVGGVASAPRVRVPNVALSGGPRQSLVLLLRVVAPLNCSTVALALVVAMVTRCNVRWYTSKYVIAMLEQVSSSGAAPNRVASKRMILQSHTGRQTCPRASKAGHISRTPLNAKRECWQTSMGNQQGMLPR